MLFQGWQKAILSTFKEGEVTSEVPYTNKKKLIRCFNELEEKISILKNSDFFVFLGERKKVSQLTVTLDKQKHVT